MHTHVYRIHAVLAGQAADAAVIGRDAEGRELRLELPAAEALAIRRGHLLVLQLSAHEVPDAPAPETSELPTTTTTSTTTTPPACSACPASDDDEICRMLGLG